MITDRQQRLASFFWGKHLVYYKCLGHKIYVIKMAMSLASFAFFLQDEGRSVKCEENSYKYGDVGRVRAIMMEKLFKVSAVYF